MDPMGMIQEEYLPIGFNPFEKNTLVIKLTKIVSPSIEVTKIKQNRWKTHHLPAPSSLDAN